jgi:endonuclease/exonuclease/phosphatase family metal-dependent hydrolase
MNLRLLTYNLAMLPFPLGNVKKIRAEKFVDKILGKSPKFDIISLQEIFDEKIRRYLTERLKHEYPYMIEKSSDHELLNQDSGLFFASKYPVLSHTFSEYRSKTLLSSDALADKGILEARIELSPGNDTRILHVILTHLQSTEIHPAGYFYGVREKQLSQLREFIEKKLENERERTDPSRLYSIVMGDFNIIGETDEYETMMNLLGRPVDLFKKLNPGKDGYTWNPNENIFIHYTDKHDRDLQRLDYFFILDHIPYSYENHDEIKIGEITGASCNIFAPKAVNVLEEDMNAECDLSDHYGLEAVIDIPGPV